MESSSSYKPGSQQDHLRLSLPLLSSADISAGDRLAHVQLLQPFPDLKRDSPACEQGQWCDETTHHRGADSTTAVATTASTVSTPPPPVLLHPPRGWPGTEVTVYLPSLPVGCDSPGHIELAFGQSRAPVRSDTFTDPDSSSRELVRILAYAPAQPPLVVEEEEGYTVQVMLYWAKSSYFVGTFTYLPATIPLTIPRPIALLPQPWSLHSSSYKELATYCCQTPSFLQQRYHDSSSSSSSSIADNRHLYEMPVTATPTSGPCIFSPQYGMCRGVLPNPSPRASALEAMHHAPAYTPLSTTLSSISRSATRKSAKGKAPATRSPALSSSAADASVALYHPYPNIRHCVDFKILGDTNRLVDDWSEKEIACSRRIVRFWREEFSGEGDNKTQSRQEGESVRSTAVQCAFEVVEDFEQGRQQQQQQNHDLLDCLPSTSLPRSVFVSCILWNDEHLVTSVDLIALIEILTNTSFDVAGKNRVRRNLEGFRPITASKYSDDTFGLFKLIMGFAEPKPRNIEKDIKIFSWRTLPFALKKLVIKHFSPSRNHSSSIRATIPASSNSCFIPPINTTTIAATTTATAAVAGAGGSVARRNEEAQRLLRHRDPASPETPPVKPATPNNDSCFVYERLND